MTHSSPIPLRQTPQFQQLLEDLGETMLVEALSAYLEELDEMSDALSRHRDDLNYLAKQAHSLKTSSRMIGALALAETALQLETACKQGRTQALDALQQSLHALIQQTRRDLLA
jgi:HPt (histidine-containing phosphotransfer) domain-containing protein